MMTADALCLADLDGRTRFVKRARALAREFSAALGGNPAPHQLILIRSAAELTAIAEQTRATLLAGGAVTLNDVVRAENAMARAIRALALPDSAKPAGLTLDEFLAARENKGNS
jgi:precorrin-6x reductase